MNKIKVSWGRKPPNPIARLVVMQAEAGVYSTGIPAAGENPKVMSVSFGLGIRASVFYLVQGLTVVGLH
jgi:hypothetical protein